MDCLLAVDVPSLERQLQDDVVDYQSIQKLLAHLDNLRQSVQDALERRKSELMSADEAVVKTITFEGDRFLTTETLPSECIKRVSESRFLTASDLGRLLLCTCRSFVDNLGSEYVFQRLCEERWGRGCYDLKAHVVQGDTSEPYRSIFRKLTVEPKWVTNDSSTLPWVASKPKLSLRNTLFFVSLQLDGQPVLSQMIPKISMESLGWSDSARFPIAKDFMVKRSIQFSLEDKCKNAQPRWSASLHCLRHDTNQTCCVMWDENLTVLETRGPGTCGEVSLESLRKNQQLEMTYRGLSMHHRGYESSVHRYGANCLPDPFRFSIRFNGRNRNDGGDRSALHLDTCHVSVGGAYGSLYLLLDELSGWK